MDARNSMLSDLVVPRLRQCSWEKMIPNMLWSLFLPLFGLCHTANIYSEITVETGHMKKVNIYKYLPCTVRCRSYSKKTVNQLYIYSTVLKAAIKCTQYSEITVESGTNVKVQKLHWIYLQCILLYILTYVKQNNYLQEEVRCEAYCDVEPNWVWNFFNALIANCSLVTTVTAVFTAITDLKEW